jgi:hypothetical protein
MEEEEEDTKTPGEVIKQYVQLRDAKKELTDSIKPQLEKIAGAMKGMEQWLLAHATKANLDCLKGSTGTAFVNTKDVFNVSDWDLFLQFISTSVVDVLRENKLITKAKVPAAIKAVHLYAPWAFFKKDVPQGTIQEFVTETGSTPPGVSQTKIKGVQVRRPKG